MAEQLKKLRIKRGQIKSAMTRFSTYLQSIQAQDINIVELKSRSDKFDGILDQYIDIQTDILALDDDATDEDILEFENTYFSLQAKASKLLVDNQANINSQNASSPVDADNKSRVQIRLPKIELPQFSGSYEDWYNFHDTFYSLIHANNTILPIEKFHYLKSSLKAEAAEVLHSLELTDTNYECAWQMLRDRYDNKRIIIQKHIKAIFDLNSINKESHSGLRHILDGILKHVRALNSLKRPTDQWDDILIYIATNKVDANTNKAWESSLSKDAIPTLKNFTDFLANRCQVLDAISRTEKTQVPYFNKSQIQKSTSAHLTTSNINCEICNDNHSIYKCDKFIKQAVSNRIQLARSKNICLNCLRSGHTTNKCRSSSCRKCNKRHNTLLHLESSDTTSASSANSTTVINHCYQSNDQHQILLSTAIINIYDIKGQPHECRALLDSGSQSCFITETLANSLGINKLKVQIPVAGINQSFSHVKNAVNVLIKSRYNDFQASVHCLILNHITENLPLNSLSKQNISIPNNIKLADPDFNISSNIDILIGAELFWSTLCVGQIKIDRHQPFFQKTHFGWIVSGPVVAESKLKNSMCNLAIQENSLDSNMARFWQMEEYIPKKNCTQEEEECENIFRTTVKRNNTGRFIVKLPLRHDIIHKIGFSRDQALKRFYALERKFKNQPELKIQYSAFINEYETLGHMKLSNQNNVSKTHLPCFYLPHHAVLKQSSLTTKLRVVFDGSARSTSGVSLNDALLTGPVIQQDLISIILRFRTHKFVLTADIEKMYRQVLVDKSHTQLQRILWRNNTNEAIKSYDLLTVSYGTTPASFLAVRSMHQLADDEQINYPVGSAITIRDFYVDDLLTGANSLTEAEIIRDEVKSMLKRGGFEIRKWISNCPELIQHLSSDSAEHTTVNLDKTENVKTLGLQWNACKDTFQYSVPLYTSNTRITKRNILSNIAQIFDPLGLLGPVIVVAKIIMQRLWQLKLSWDESVPTDIHSIWFQYVNQMHKLNQLTVPRWIVNNNQFTQIELHGFCDASEEAYGACIYMRVVSKEMQTSTLVCAKSRVAPLQNITLPRLELCGALLLARLMKKTTSAINMHTNNICYWTDSTITLAWITSVARTWKTFVANRVSEIQDLTNSADWRHVSTSENPADVISRGQTAEQLIKNSLWWHGPDWLKTENTHWPGITLNQDITEIPEQRTSTTAFVATGCNNELLSKYSSMNKLVRVVAYCFRFKHNMACRRSKLPENLQLGPLTTSELLNATNCIIRKAQQEGFRQELHDLSEHHSVNPKSKLLCLNPFLDKTGLIRVGGRLRHSDISYSQKHPILLPNSHPLTKLIITREHINQLHAGAQNTLAAIRTKYWPLGARSAVRQIIKNCVICFKAKPVAAEHIMGDLPAARLKQSRPFSNTGVDYFGPLSVREGKRRNSKTIKAYGAIFVCFATKAVHIELVSDLSSETFINALKRFMARRGKPNNIYSDNGTNFVGANKELRELCEMFTAESNKNKIVQAMAQDNVTWHFIPPRAPHFGGIWEAAVKSIKHHLRRIIEHALLTYEEMTTLLVQIEAILNSRPLTPLSNDPNDFSFLTPGHFLIGDALTSTPEPDLLPLKLNSLSRWQYVERLRQHFWTRWYKEYLGELQQRNKWKKMSSGRIELGRLVLIREDNTPPQQWPLGRIDAIHPGQDGVIRAVTVRTSAGTYKRPTRRLCPLPIDNK